MPEISSGTYGILQTSFDKRRLRFFRVQEAPCPNRKGVSPEGYGRVVHFLSRIAEAVRSEETPSPLLYYFFRCQIQGALQVFRPRVGRATVDTTPRDANPGAWLRLPCSRFSEYRGVNKAPVFGDIQGAASLGFVGYTAHVQLTYGVGGEDEGGGFSGLSGVEGAFLRP